MAWFGGQAWGEAGGVEHPGDTLGSSRAQQGCAADALQRPLRSRFQARLTPGVRRLRIMLKTEQVWHE